MARMLTIVFAAITLSVTGCVTGHPTPYGTMRLREWKYVQSLSPEQQAVTGPIYVEEFKTRILLHE